MWLLQFKLQVRSHEHERYFRLKKKKTFLPRFAHLYQKESCHKCHSFLVLNTITREGQCMYVLWGWREVVHLLREGENKCFLWNFHTKWTPKRKQNVLMKQAHTRKTVDALWRYSQLHREGNTVEMLPKYRTLQPHQLSSRIHDAFHSHFHLCNFCTSPSC